MSNIVRIKRKVDVARKILVWAWILVWSMFMFRCLLDVFTDLPKETIETTGGFLLLMVWGAVLLTIILGGMATSTDTQQEITKYYNAHRALNSGNIFIVTNDNDTLRQIADAVSDHFRKLDVYCHGSGSSHNKHCAVASDDSDIFYLSGKSRLQRIRPDECKLTLCVRAGASGPDGIFQTSYCLIDNGHQSVLSGRYHRIEHERKSIAQIAREIAETIFCSVNITVRAETATKAS